jgi:hypothetical protein
MNDVQRVFSCYNEAENVLTGTKLCHENKVKVDCSDTHYLFSFQQPLYIEYFVLHLVIISNFV